MFFYENSMFILITQPLLRCEVPQYSMRFSDENYSLEYVWVDLLYTVRHDFTIKTNGQLSFNL